MILFRVAEQTNYTRKIRNVKKIFPVKFVDEIVQNNVSLKNIKIF